MSVSEIGNISRMINCRSMKFSKYLLKVAKFGVYSIYRFTARKIFRAAGKNILAGLKGLKQAGIDVSIYKAQCCRLTSSSKAKLLKSSLEEILRRVQWSGKSA